jgi:tyrosyl-tRNA synthetase
MITNDEKKVDELLTRGVSEVIVKSELRKKLLSGEQLRVKLGIDPTSPDLHIGRAVPLLKLRDFQKLGHHVILIVGDFTAIIGDTSDKDAERPMLERDIIEKNKESYFKQAGKIIDLDKVELRYNSEWLEPLTYREIGEHADQFSVADFIARDVIKRRLDAGKRVSLREMIYPLMQGYDSVAVKADVELGGTDQKFNLLAGRTLQQKFGQRPQDILMSPLIDGLDGAKMSSSRGNYIALTAPSADMYGKIMSMSDNQVMTYFELCTRISMEELEDIKNALASESLHPKDAKMRLAREIVTMYYDADAAQKAEDDWISTFSEGGVPENIQSAPPIKYGGSLIEAIGGLGISNSEMRRLLIAGAIREVEGEKEIFTDLKNPINRDMVIRIGKHRFVRVRVS